MWLLLAKEKCFGIEEEMGAGGAELKINCLTSYLDPKSKKPLLPCSQHLKIPELNCPAGPTSMLGGPKAGYCSHSSCGIQSAVSSAHPMSQPNLPHSSYPHVSPKFRHQQLLTHPTHSNPLQVTSPTCHLQISSPSPTTSSSCRTFENCYYLNFLLNGMEENCKSFIWKGVNTHNI